MASSGFGECQSRHLLVWNRESRRPRLERVKKEELKYNGAIY